MCDSMIEIDNDTYYDILFYLKEQYRSTVNNMYVWSRSERLFICSSCGHKKENYKDFTKEMLSLSYKHTPDCDVYKLGKIINEL
jgi:hypothetical protein